MLEIEEQVKFWKRWKGLGFGKGWENESSSNQKIHFKNGKEE